MQNDVRYVRFKNTLILFVLILCTTTIGPQEPQYDQESEEDQERPKTPIYYKQYYSQNYSESDDATVSWLIDSEACQPMYKNCSGSEWYNGRSVSAEDRHYYNEVARSQP